MPPRIPSSATIAASSTRPSRRHLHGSMRTKPIPPPTPFVPDVPTFLKLIGRQTLQHASKFPSWESLFQNQSPVLRSSGIEPARTRRYLLWWRERYRRGEFGFGGDLTEVVDGMAELRIADRNGKKVVVNTRLGDTEVELEDRSAGVSGVKILQPGVLSGPHLKIQKGSFGTVATLKIEEGMWEQKRGRKVKGGERKRKIEEKREKVRKEKEEREKALGLS